MAEQKNTHVAVHSIEYNDEKGARVVIAPGTEFTPNKADLEHLEGSGAARKLGKAVVADDADETDETEGKGKKK
jgi:hypothetical protein